MHRARMASRMRTILVLLAGLALAGCTADDPGTPTPTQTPVGTTPATTTASVTPTQTVTPPALTPTPTATPATTPPPATSTPVEIRGFAFGPADITVAHGTSVTWTNKDASAHTVTSDDGTSFNSGRLAQGQPFTHAFATAGTFAYHCAYHPEMTGTVTVT